MKSARVVLGVTNRMRRELARTSARTQMGQHPWPPARGVTV